MYRLWGCKIALGSNGISNAQANVTAQLVGSLFPQAKPSILTFGLLAPQDGEPTSTLPAPILPKELPRGEKDGVFLPNSGSWITGLLVRTGGEPQKKPAWLLESVSTSGSFWNRGEKVVHHSRYPEEYDTAQKHEVSKFSIPRKPLIPC